MTTTTKRATAPAVAAVRRLGLGCRYADARRALAEQGRSLSRADFGRAMRHVYGPDYVSAPERVALRRTQRDRDWQALKTRRWADCEGGDDDAAPEAGGRRVRALPLPLASAGPTRPVPAGELDERVKAWRAVHEAAGACPRGPHEYEIAGDCVAVKRCKGGWRWLDYDRLTVGRPSWVRVFLSGGPFPTVEAAVEDARRVLEG